MAEVPESQRVERVLATNFNQAFADKAANLCPTLYPVPRYPLRLIEVGKDASAFFGLAVTKSIPTTSLPNISLARGSTIVLDFGLHLVGFLSFNLTATGVNIDSPARLLITFGETLLDVHDGMENVQTWISTAWLPDEIINVDYFPAEVKIPRRHACRYVRVDVIDTSPKFSISIADATFSAISNVKQDQTITHFDFQDKTLNQIDQVSILTLRDCMQTVFEDGPRRDRRLWIGDLRLQALANYATFKDYDLVKRCLYMFAAVSREDGSLAACVFEKPKLIPASDYIVDYDSLFAATVWEYVQASGDIDTGRELWATVCGGLKRAIEHVVPQTSVFEESRGTGWKFLDWEEKLDRQAGLHGLLIVCLKAVVQLGKALEQEVAVYEGLLRGMIGAATRFYDQDQGIFVSGPRRQISLASAAWLVLSDAFPADQARSCLRTASSHPDRVEPLTPYLWHYVCEAMISVGLVDEAITLLKSYWGGMIDAGADTFWECYKPSEPRFSPYGDVRNNSFCHAWSCTPSYLLRDKLAGHLRATTRASSMKDYDELWLARCETASS